MTHTFCIYTTAAAVLGMSITLATGASVDRGPWSGAVTHESATVKVKMDQPDTQARLIVSTTPELADSIGIDAEPSHGQSNIATFQMIDLDPQTTYHYAVEIDGEILRDSEGRFQTFPTPGPQTFTFAFGACANTNSRHPVFTNILRHEPLFYMNVGDLHYRDIRHNEPDRFRGAFDQVLGSPTQAELYRNIAFAYIWDDHDFGPNDSDRTAPGREAARLVYREYVPHYPLAFGEGDQPIDQFFIVGRVRFILSDLRSERSPKQDPDDEEKIKMNDEQLEWWKQQVLEARQQGQAIFWVSPVPWISQPVEGGDHWGGYTTQRAVIANWLAEQGVDNLMILSGDAHMLAADDGTNSNFSEDPDAPVIPVLQAGALDQNGSRKGGPYSEGTEPNRTVDEFRDGQFGLVTVNDHGDRLEVTFQGMRVNPNRPEADPETGEYEVIGLTFQLRMDLGSR